MLLRHEIEHVVVPPGFDDGVLRPGQVTPGRWVAALAYLKASSPTAMREADARQWRVLGADTVCVLDDRIIGQPADATAARETIEAFENREHDVLTGAALVSPGNRARVIFTDRAVVRVGAIGAARISEYVASGLWRGKAGAYNLSERLAAGWPIEVDGDPDTVMGLPMRRLLSMLSRGRTPTFARHDVREAVP